MAISSCDENRLQLAELAEMKLKQARELANVDDHAGALDAYLIAFDNSRFVSGWGGVRLSYIPAEIARLGKKFPPAKLALQQRRDAREQLVLKGEKDFDVLSEWLSLNKYLNAKDRELRILNDLLARGILDDLVRERIIDSNFARLLKAKRYELLADYLDKFGNQFLFQIFHFEQESLFNPKSKLVKKADSNFWKRHIAAEGGKVFELALALNKERQADEIAKRVLLVSDGVEGYRMLLVSASHVGNKPKARELLKQDESNS